jgi:exodeoxyribonuclease VII large subunit
MPATIGIISSPDGAAVHDILSVLKRRFPAVDVILYPVAVQGEASARQLVEAVRLADSRQECDVLIISRGGGSLEDLWSFNDEQLARAIYDCKLPVISAVGHEVDFTIADFVADVRAPTPSAAAEMAVPDARQLLATVQNLMQRLTARTRQWLTGEQRHLLHLQRRLPRPDLQIRQQNQAIKQYKRMLDAAWQRDQQNRAQRVDFLAARLKHPQAQIDSQRARLDNLMHRLQTALRSQQKQAAQSVVALQSRLRRQLPAQQVARQQLHLSGLKRQLDKLIQTQLSIAGSMLSQQVRTLAAVSPLNTLERGYSISRRIDTEEVITRSEQVRPGDAIRVKLRQGEIDCEVRAVKDK